MALWSARQSTTGTNTTTGALAVNWTLGPVAGALLVALYGCNATNSTVTTPTGYTASTGTFKNFNSSAWSIQVFWKIADGSESSVSISTSAGTQNHMYIAEWSPPRRDVPFYVGFTTESSGTVTSLDLASAFITAGAPANDTFVFGGVFAAGAHNGGASATGGYTVATTTNRLLPVYKVDTQFNNTTETTVSWSTARNAGGVLTGFMPARGPDFNRPRQVQVAAARAAER